MALAGDRRAILRGAVAAALAPALASRAVVAVAANGQRIAPPAGPMTFTRRLERTLPGGNRLIVARRFAVGFAPAATGWTIAGQQVGVTVEAPPRIAALAALERQRVETGLFPLALDRAGLILGGPDSRPAKELDAAIAIVRRELAADRIATDERAEFEAFLRAVQSAETRLTAKFPGDLFAPRAKATRSARELALPGGTKGTIELSFSAVTDPATGLMREARREIVTTIGGDRRLTREDWALTPV
jgi:hypothetical protein